MSLIRTLGGAQGQGGGRGGSHGDFGGFVFSLLHPDRVDPARIMISPSRASFLDLSYLLAFHMSYHDTDWIGID